MGTKTIHDQVKQILQERLDPDNYEPIEEALKESSVELGSLDGNIPTVLIAIEDGKVSGFSLNEGSKMNFLVVNLDTFDSGDDLSLDIFPNATEADEG